MTSIDHDSVRKLDKDTIVAMATPPGRGGIAVLRVSGSKVRTIIQQLLQKELQPRQASFRCFYGEKEVIDEGLALFFPAPHSFTGEDVLELQGHGGPVVVDLLLARILMLGVRMARPGEFSERAFLNGKMDLAQAEAVADLINAASYQAVRGALRSLQGEFSQEITKLNEQLITLRTYVEAAIDFSDEEIDFLSDQKLQSNMQRLLESIEIIQAQAKQGSFLREGIQVVIAGKPNVGKSSLLNALSGQETAIVTAIPGTTRDVLHSDILIDGMPIHIVDTAGLRESEDVVEQEGIRRAHQAMQQADLILHVYDTQVERVNGLDVVSALTAVPQLYVFNKIDLSGEAPAFNLSAREVRLSAKTGAGLPLLREAIKTLVGFVNNTEGIYLARRRHLDALKRAYTHTQSGMTHLVATHAFELVAEELRLAQIALNEITGEFTSDDLLGSIFANFCIGK